MGGTGHQIVVAPTVQEGIHAIKRIQLAEACLELLPQDRAIVGGQLFLLRGPLLQPVEEFLRFFRRELAHGARLLAGIQAGQTLPPVAADPRVDKLP